MDAKSLKGEAVVTVEPSEKIGTIGDIVFDTRDRRIGAFRVESGGFLRKQKQYLPFAAVRSVGSDAVMIQDNSVLQDEYRDRPNGYHTLDKITGIRVVSDSGTYIGNVSTVHFDPTSGAITEFEVGQSGLTSVLKSNKVIDANTVINIGEDIMIVPAGLVGEEPEPQNASGTTA